ncbi:ABC transporter ATP-binding protein [Consotaella aegiceratis]|uniref:ABC transporter ATP-binding protein n=1 Tax=Consotaella aegiceratis TaxID=3097961 RepID=UPI002F4105A5
MAPLLDIRNLTVEFDTPGGIVHAVNDLSYTVEAGETLGIVGESGSGKTVHILAVLGLLQRPPGRIVSGQAFFNGRDLMALNDRQMRDIRGGEIGMVFQDPMSSLNPVLTVGRQLREVLERHSGLSGRALKARMVELLDIVGIPHAEARLSQYPHEFSGGMRQRVMIAIGLSCNPRLLVADEATTALDVTVQAQILDLVRKLKDEFNTTVIWITHDMGVVAELADTIQVMYGGRIMERGPVSPVFHDPRSAYTWGLLRSLPHEGARGQHRLYQIPGSPPNMANPPPGDPFAPRNPFATEQCRREMPPLREVGDVSGHQVAAWYDLPSCLAAAKEPAS